MASSRSSTLPPDKPGTGGAAALATTSFTIIWTMNGLWILAVVILVSAVGGGCDQGSKPASSPPAPATATPPAAAPDEPTGAQPKLRTLKLFIGAEEMVAEVAVEPLEVHTGMMFRTNMEENAGMLFVLPYTQQAQFWMKNCPLPLSVAYMNEEGIIREIHDLQPYNTNSVVAATSDIRFALETPQGWFQKHHIRPGVAVATERGPLMRTFLGKR